ncbi:MAG: hypothetical protein JXM70_19760 [Pirellulales bacterium]|nr:hypothetical protein [Pirellulales bacterium]
MAMSFFALIILVVFGLLVIAGIATLCHKRTRWLGYILLLIPVGLLALLTIMKSGFIRINSSNPSWFIFAIPIVGTAAVGAIALFVALLVNKRTRPVGLALLAVPPLLSILLLLGWFVTIPVRTYNAASATAVVDNTTTREFRLHSPHTRQQPTPILIPEPVRSKTNTSTKTKTESTRKKSGRVVESLGAALGKTFVELYVPNINQAAPPKKTPKSKPTPTKKTPKKTADKTKKPADKKKLKSNEAAQIAEIARILSVAVQEELPENVEINQFAVLRALSTIVGRMIASEQQGQQETSKSVAVAVASKIPEVKKENKKTAPATEAGKPEASKDTKKTSAVAVSVEKASTSNDKQPSGGKNAKDPAKSAEHKKSPSPDKKRPDWVETSPQKVGDGYQMVVMVGPYMTRLECDQAMNGQLAGAVSEYAELYLGREAAGKATLPPSFLRDHVIKEQWEETYESKAVGRPMVQVHVRLVFDARTNTELKENYRRAVIQERLWIAGLGLGVILIVMTGCFAVLKFDESTGGAYRVRMVLALFFAVVMAIAVLGTWLMTSVRPLPVQTEAVNTQEISHKHPAMEWLDPVQPDKAVLHLVKAETVSAGKAQAGEVAKLPMIAPLLLGLPACMLLVLWFFPKTRKMSLISLILLSLGVMLVAGSLLLVV